MGRNVVRVMLLAVITFAALTPSAEAATVDSAIGCGFPSPFHNCADESELRYFCNYVCPN